MAVDPGAVGMGRLPLPAHAVHIAAFGAAAAFLIVGSRTDARIVRLGAVLLIIASSYAYRPATLVEGSLPPAMAVTVEWSRHLPSDAFLPLALWLFFRDFPRTFVPVASSVATAAIWVSGLAGALLFAGNLALLLLEVPPPFLKAFARDLETSQYWSVTYGLIAPALPFAIWKVRWTPPEEQRRVSVFLSGLMLGAVPVTVVVLFAALLPEFGAFMLTARGKSLVLPAVNLSVATVPFTTAYAVWVERVLDVRSVLWSALQYGLVKAVVAIACVAPFVWLAIGLYERRGDPVSSLFTTAALRPLGLPAAMGLLALWGRRTAIDSIDRYFFREIHDARTILTELVNAARSAEDSAALAALLAHEIDRALHLDCVEVFVSLHGGRSLESHQGRVRPLDSASDIASTLGSGIEILDVDLENTWSHAAELPPNERQWIANGGFQLLVSLHGSSGQLLGFIALGSKRSDLAFSSDDRLLLRAVSAAVSPVLERLLQRPSAAGRSVAESMARECTTCARLWPEDTEMCHVCHTETRELGLPYRLVGKFQLDARIGEGSMGVVYRAQDLTLRRAVAIKTLPQTTPEAAIRLRREARAMAAVSHSSLASIYGVESWRSTPLLIVEYLDGGTLEDIRLKGPVAPARAVEIGIALSDALDRVHSRGMLHRDVKPSNIGFTSDGSTKLLDFGLAHIVRGVRPQWAGTDGVAVITSSQLESRDSLVGAGFAGTPLYMSPEAIRGAEPDPSFDLWSTAMVLYEVIAQRNPVERATWSETVSLIRQGRIPDIREFAPECSSELASLLAESLHRQRAKRLATAKELAHRLRRLQA